MRIVKFSGLACTGIGLDVNGLASGQLPFADGTTSNVLGAHSSARPPTGSISSTSLSSISPDGSVGPIPASSDSTGSFVSNGPSTTIPGDY